MAKKSEATELATVPTELQGGLVVQGEESGGGLNMGRLVLYQGTVEEENKYGSDHKRGDFLDALESRNLGNSVKIMPAAAWMQWIKWPDVADVPEYIHTRKGDVPPGDADWSGVHGDIPPVAKEVVNVLVAVEGEDWPFLFQFKSTGLKAWNKQIRPIEARRGGSGKVPGMYELGTVDDKNGAGQPYKRLIARPAGEPTAEMIETAVSLRRMFDQYQKLAAEQTTADAPQGDDTPF